MAAPQTPPLTFPLMIYMVFAHNNEPHPCLCLSLRGLAREEFADNWPPLHTSPVGTALPGGGAPSTVHTSLPFSCLSQATSPWLDLALGGDWSQLSACLAL